VAGGKQRIYRQKIASTASLQKVFRAQELIAASRIGKARARTAAAAPFAEAITRAVSAVAVHTTIEHLLTEPRHDTDRCAILIVGADRGMAGAYTASILREAEKLFGNLRDEGKEYDLYVAGRRAVSYYTYRGHTLAGSWEYGSDEPTPEVAGEIADTLLHAFQAPAADGGVGELHVVYTQFVNMVTQKPRVVRMLPLEVVEGVSAPEDIEPLYDFEPSASEVLDALLPRYIRSRLFSFLLESAASELASRQSAMHTATDNAQDLITTYTRKANAARQGDITQEITEIVSGADALANSH
jgi:F-type H+-transporting ATPase subunit gamma